MPRKANQHTSVRVKRDGKLKWIDATEVLPGEETFPLPPRQPTAKLLERIGFEASDGEVEAVAAEAAAPVSPDITALLQQMQADMAAMREENATLRTDLAAVTRDVRRGGKGAKRAIIGLPKRRPPGEYPVPYYNPIAMDEQFTDIPEGEIKPGTRINYQVFRNGVFYAWNEHQESVVRLALRGYGPDKPDRWKGDDLHEMESCANCGFRSYNRKASNDHLNRFTDHRFERHE